MRMPCVCRKAIGHPLVQGKVERRCRIRPSTRRKVRVEARVARGGSWKAASSGSRGAHGRGRDDILIGTEESCRPVCRRAWPRSVVQGWTFRHAGMVLSRRVPLREGVFTVSRDLLLPFARSRAFGDDPSHRLACCFFGDRRRRCRQGEWHEGGIALEFSASCAKHQVEQVSKRLFRLTSAICFLKRTGASSNVRKPASKPDCRSARIGRRALFGCMGCNLGKDMPDAIRIGRRVLFREHPLRTGHSSSRLSVGRLYLRKAAANEPRSNNWTR